jgi:hypothetical protein
MGMPTFTAEASLYQTNERYRMAGAIVQTEGIIQPAQRSVNPYCYRSCYNFCRSDPNLYEYNNCTSSCWCSCSGGRACWQ